MLADVFCREWQALTAGIAAADSVAAAADMAAASRRFCAGLAAGGSDGIWLAHTMAELNDRVVERVIRLTAREYRLPAVPWCWLALGSEGRFEQTFITDQDNGLVFSAADSAEAEALRQYFLPFAQAVNARLDRCGFAFCHGEIMAGNPKWCLALDEWQALFADWVRKPEPQALMHATIFFDFRCLFGDRQLAERLRQHQFDVTHGSQVFIHLMTANALEAEVPLNFLGDIVAHEAGHKVDLKKFGARIIVDAARIFALAGGCPRIETPLRLREAGPAAGLRPEELAAVLSAFSHLLRLRLQKQASVLAAGGTPDHGVDPKELHEFDRVVLREALHQAKRLQQRLKLNYAL